MPALSKTSADPFTLVGSTLGQTYRLEGVIGSSAHGASYTARHVRAPTRCALKLLPPMDSQRRAALADHLGRCAGLAHPHLSLVYDVLELPDGQLALCSPLLDGEDLATRVGLRGQLTRAEGLLVARQAAGALLALHKLGLVHGNLTLRNVFLARYDDVAIDDALGQSKGAYGVRLMDIGLHLCDGTQAAPADDQRALAVLLSENVADLTATQQRALQRAQAAQPQRRFASMQEFWQALDGMESRASMATEVKRRKPGDAAASTATAVVPRSSAPMSVLSAGAEGAGEAGPASRLRLAVVAVAAVVALMLVILATRVYRYALHRRDEPAAAVPAAAALAARPLVGAPANEHPPASPAVQEVTLRFRTTPEDAQVQVDGAAVTDSEVRLARGQRAVTVVATAPGYLRYQDSLVPSGDRTVEISLLPAATAAPVSAKDRKRRHHHGKHQQ